MYRIFEELDDKFLRMYKGKEGKGSTASKKGFIKFLNALEANNDILVSDYFSTNEYVIIEKHECGHKIKIKPHRYCHTDGKCNICHGRQFLKGSNDIASTHPEFVKYFYYIEDTYNNRFNSNKTYKLKCPDCGCVKNMKLGNLVHQGFCCDCCSDGISYPEKVVCNVLRKLDIEYTKQYKFNGYKFKYNIITKDNKIIEIHGKQHYDKDMYGTCEEQHNIDLLKYDISVIHGYEYNKNFFIIDARESSIEWIKNSIINNKFFQMYDINKIDWEEIDSISSKSIKMEVINYWNENKPHNKKLTAADVDKIFNIGSSSTYLKWGNEKGLCSYNGKEEADKAHTKYHIYLVKPNGEKWFDEPMTINELSDITGISRKALMIRASGKLNTPLGVDEHAKRIKFDKKYKGSIVINCIY